MYLWPLTVVSEFSNVQTAGADDRIQIWNVEQIYQAVHTFQTDFTVYTMDVDNSRLVTGNKQGWLQVYSLEK